MKVLSKNGKFDQKTFDSFLQEEVDNEILFERLFLKLNESDPVVRKWREKYAFYRKRRWPEEEQKGDDEDYFKKALAVGMDRRYDRGSSIQKMKRYSLQR